MKFCNCTLGGTEACKKCIMSAGDYYAQLDDRKFLRDVLEREQIKRINRLELEETEFEKFIRLLIDEVEQNDE